MLQREKDNIFLPFFLPQRPDPQAQAVTCGIRVATGAMTPIVIPNNPAPARGMTIIILNSHAATAKIIPLLISLLPRRNPFRSKVFPVNTYTYRSFFFRHIRQDECRCRASPPSPLIRGKPKGFFRGAHRSQNGDGWPESFYWLKVK